VKVLTRARNESGCLDRNGKDLNRGFPDRSDQGVPPSLPVTGLEEPEVQAVMRLAHSLPITAAASLHEGALVANFPWDGDAQRQPGYAAAPDDSTFVFLARTYAQAHTRMAAQTPFGKNPPTSVRSPACRRVHACCTCMR
jgi:carboxypeptidase D